MIVGTSAGSIVAAMLRWSALAPNAVGVEPGTAELSVAGLDLMDRSSSLVVLREAFLATGDRIAAGGFAALVARLPDVHRAVHPG